ncbi:hypothetical protein KY385_04445 [Candidatus Parcubacteria bacterium]|nr:hypothetical protein [Candidatus Parcubacteria bacterium]
MNQFIFKNYSFDLKSKTARFVYSFDDGQEFSESYLFDFEFADFNPEALDRALQLLFFIAGVSYYKAYLPPKIVVQKGKITNEIANFLQRTYKKGLGELLYKNNLAPDLDINFPVNVDVLPAVKINQSQGILVSIGGGKDSLLSYELLKSADKLATWSLGHKQQLSPLVNTIGSKHLWVKRQIDPKIIKLKEDRRIYTGHIPISAIFACVGSVVAILSGYRDSVVSNEQSANESTLNFKNHEINHQYSKTSEFERNFQKILANQFGDSIRYYSLIRPLREIAVVREFALKYFDKYAGVFSSCNRAFTQNAGKIFWCGRCPKCAGVYLLMAPFIDADKLASVFSSNLLLEPQLELIYRQLLGIQGDKPFECVGEIAENRWAMSRMKSHYPNLAKYKYQEASDEKVWNLSEHNIPADVIDRFNLEQNFVNIAKA